MCLWKCFHVEVPDRHHLIHCRPTKWMAEEMLIFFSLLLELISKCYRKCLTFGLSWLIKSAEYRGHLKELTLQDQDVIHFPIWTSSYLSPYMVLVLFFWRLLILEFHGSVNSQIYRKVKSERKIKAVYATHASEKYALPFTGKEVLDGRKACDSICCSWIHSFILPVHTG